ncbi:MAG: DUF99 family protein [Planctomycetes bacterium]|nr:DUF99 family protein [Planctomycetota bacterium]MCB9890897.1 DUF99 family protein [Planctomycetota bacterium]
MTRAGIHVLGIDDAPFDKHERRIVRVLGVVMAGPQVEGVHSTFLDVDDALVTERLATWIANMRVLPILRAVFFDSLTIAGLGVIDLQALHEHTNLPCLIVTRRAPSTDRVARALQVAGLEDRRPLLERELPSTPLPGGFLRYVGCDEERAIALHASARGKTVLAEAVRLAHLIGQGVERGESHGAV